MNLIEQLGGYEKAKEMYTVQLKAGLAPYGYEEAFLEYRRQHNIFEVGDWVGIKDGSITWIDKIVSIKTNSVFDSQWNKENVEILIFEDGTKLGSGWAIHATDAEIAAGKRLEGL